MPFTSCIEVPVKLFSYDPDALSYLGLTTFFFSDEFGDENRIKYLNYIRVQDGKPGFYERTLAFLYEHPVLTRCLMAVTEVAIRLISALVDIFEKFTSIPMKGLIYPKAHWDEFLYLHKIDHQLNDYVTASEINVWNVSEIDEHVNILNFNSYRFCFENMAFRIRQKYLKLQALVHASLIESKIKELKIRLEKPSFDDPDEIYNIKYELLELVRKHLRIFYEANQDLYNISEDSNIYTAEELKKLNQNIDLETDAIFNLIVEIGNDFQQKGKEPFQKLHEALKELDPVDKPVYFYQTYEACLTLLDPFERTQAVKDFKAASALHKINLFNLNWDENIPDRIRKTINSTGENIEQKTRTFQSEFCINLHLAFISVRKLN